MGGVARLHADHVVLRGAAQRLLALTTAEAGYRAVAPGLLRDLADMLTAHGETEAGTDYARLGGPAADGAGAVLAERLLAFQMEWEAFVDAWPTMRVASDWPGFSAEARTILPRLIAMVEAEEAVLAGAGRRAGAAG